MINLKSARDGFRYEHLLGPVEGKPNARKVILFSVFYLKSMSGVKGVRIAIRPTEIEQCEGYTCESTLLYNEANISVWGKLLSRKSDKEVLAIAEAIDNKVPLVVNAYLEGNGKDALAQLAHELR